MRRKYLLIIIAVLVIAASILAINLIINQDKTASQVTVSSTLQELYDEQYSSSQVTAAAARYSDTGFDTPSVELVSPEAGAILIENDTNRPITYRLSTIPSGYTGNLNFGPVSPRKAIAIDLTTPGIYEVSDLDDQTNKMKATFTLTEEPARQ